MSKSRLGWKMSFPESHRSRWQGSNVHHQAVGCICIARRTYQVLCFHFVHGILAPAGYLVNLFHILVIASRLECLAHLLHLRLHTRNHVLSSSLGRPRKRQQRGPIANIRAMPFAGSKQSAICNQSSAGIRSATAPGIGICSPDASIIRAAVFGESSGAILWRISVG